MSSEMNCGCVSYTSMSHTPSKTSRGVISGELVGSSEGYTPELMVRKRGAPNEITTETFHNEFVRKLYYYQEVNGDQFKHLLEWTESLISCCVQMLRGGTICISTASFLSLISQDYYQTKDKIEKI